MKKNLDQYRFRKEAIKCLPKYFEGTEVVDFQTELFVRHNNTLEAGIALIQEDGTHLTVSINEAYNAYADSGYNYDYIDAFCKSLSEKYKHELKASIEAIRHKLDQEGLENRLCCITGMINSSGDIDKQIRENRGPVTLSLGQFIKDDSGCVSIAEVTDDMLKKCDALKEMSNHELIEAAIANTAKHFRPEINDLYDVISHKIVKRMVDAGMLPGIPEICEGARVSLCERISEDAPPGVVLSNESPYDVVTLFYPKLLTDASKMLRSKKLAIFISSTDEVVIYTGDYSDPNKLRELAQNTNEMMSSVEMSIKYTLLYDAETDKITYV